MSLRRTRVPRGEKGAVGAAGGSSAASYACIRDERAANTAGDNIATGDWRTRTLQTEQADDDDIVALSSNQMTLDAGTYICHATAIAHACNSHQTRLRNTSDNVTVLVGTSEYVRGGGGNDETESHIVGQFTIGASKALEVQHRTGVTLENVQMNFGEVEVYTVVELWKIG